MATRIENNPSPNVLMNSMRSIGYSFKVALADVIDNSISAKAKNVYIYSPINEDNLAIGILDDGEGMDDEELFNAMKYGSDREEYGEGELGRFGVGLKSASLSQCRVLTVVSKLYKNLNAYKWDLDEVINQKQWCCLKLNDKEINDIPYICELKKLDHGTLVVWENFDVIAKKSKNHVSQYLIDEMYDAEKHLSLVFHRYLNDKNIKIFINNGQINGLDPFLENNPKTDSKSPSELKCEGSLIKVQAFILPHQNDLTDKDLEKLGGMDYFRSGQGFYVYRNKRLIIYGTWFRLSATNVSSELYKYGRIKVDIPNSLDDIWEIDIKKQNAVIPKTILNQLKTEVINVCNRSKDKTNKRAKLTLDKDDKSMWKKSLDREGKEVFSINEDSDFLKSFLDEFEDKDKLKILNLVEIISATLPTDDIHKSICNRNISNEIDEEKIALMVKMGINEAYRMQKIIQKPLSECVERICSYQPYNIEEISKRIKEGIKND